MSPEKRGSLKEERGLRLREILGSKGDSFLTGRGLKTSPSKHYMESFPMEGGERKVSTAEGKTRFCLGVFRKGEKFSLEKPPFNPCQRKSQFGKGEKTQREKEGRLERNTSRSQWSVERKGPPGTFKN